MTTAAGAHVRLVFAGGGVVALCFCGNARVVSRGPPLQVVIGLESVVFPGLFLRTPPPRSTELRIEPPLQGCRVQ